MKTEQESIAKCLDILNLIELPEGINVHIIGNLHYREIQFFGAKTYNDAVALLRLLQIREWKKNPSAAISWIYAKKEDIEITVFHSGLPPTCRLEKVTKRIPKTEVKEVDGEFVEIEEEKVVCHDN